MKSTCFHLKGFVKFACKKRHPRGKGVLEMRSVCTGVEPGEGEKGGLWGGAALSCHMSYPDQE